MAAGKSGRFQPRRVFGIYRPPDHRSAEYASGWRDGYEAGRRSVTRSSNPEFEGVSIILLLPPGKGRRGLQEAVRHLEAVTPGPLEILISGYGADEAVKAYAGRRAGAVRWIRTEPAEGAAQVINRAVRSAWSRTLVLLSGDAVPPEGWLQAVVKELRRHTKAGAVFVQSRDHFDGPGDPGKAGVPDDAGTPWDPPATIEALAFSREAWEAAGEWTDGDLAGGCEKWLKKLALAGFRPRDASGTFR